MQTSSERRRLVEQMYQEPAHPWIRVALCAAGLAILMLVVLVDFRGDERSVVPPTSVSAASGEQEREPGAGQSAPRADD